MEKAGVKIIDFSKSIRYFTISNWASYEFFYRPTMDTKENSIQFVLCDEAHLFRKNKSDSALIKLKSLKESQRGRKYGVIW